MTIDPVLLTTKVKVPPARAFELFTTRMGEWWPKGKTIAKVPHATIVVEPRDYGRWYERDADGQETPWGRVLAWEPPSRLLLSWQMTCDGGYDPTVETEVEVTFAATRSGTLVTLEHRRLERFGVNIEHRAASVRAGWPPMLDIFAAYADAQD